MKLQNIIEELQQGLLKKIDIAFHEFTDEEAEQLMQTLPVEQLALQLRLNRCEINLYTSQILANVLKKNISLKLFELIDSKIPLKL